MNTIETLGSPFKYLVMTIGELPTTFVESMSYYEALAWLVNYMEKTLLPAVNNNAEATKELQEAFNELKQYVDSYFENLDVQEEINNKLDEMAESGQLQEIIALYIQLGSVLAYNSVSEMQSATNLVNGSFVKTFGYFNAYDGGGALYKVSDTESSDYYQIELANDLYANMVIGESIDYRQFGAYLDGTHDDTDAVVLAHTWANKTGAKVTGKGTLYMPTAVEAKHPVINTSCDFSDLTFKFDNNSSANLVMVVADPTTLTNATDIQNVSLNLTAIGQLSPDTVSPIQILESYKNCYINLRTNMSFGKRRNVDETIYYQQGFMVDDYGTLAPNNMYADIASNATEVVMRYLPMTQKPINIKFGTIQIDGNTTSNPRILTMRNNVTMENGTLIKTNASQDTVWANALFDFRYCYNITVRGFHGNNPTHESGSSDITNYPFLFVGCSVINFSDNQILKGKGGFTSHFCSFITVDNCVINRVDNHYGIYGEFNITNSSIIGYPGVINLGYGNANVNISNCYFEKYNENEKPYIENIVLCRRDLPVLFSGTININNVKIEGRDSSDHDRYCTLFSWYPPASYDGAVWAEWATYTSPIVNIENVDAEMSNVKYRTFTIQLSNAHEYSLQNVAVKNSDTADSDQSILNGQNYLDSSNATISVTNDKILVSNVLNSLILESKGYSEIQSGSNNLTINNFGRCKVSGNAGYCNNYGYLETVTGSNILYLKSYNNALVQGTTIRELYATGVFTMGGDVTLSQNSYIQGCVTGGGNLINGAELRVMGSLFNFNSCNNTNGTIIITGSQMASSKAGSLSGNGTIAGNGNHAGANSSVINTL